MGRVVLEVRQQRVLAAECIRLRVEISDNHENGSNFLVGVGRGAGLGYLLLSGRWGVTEGNGKWGE